MSVDAVTPTPPPVWSPGYAADPHPTHTWLRQHDPLHRDSRSGLTLLSRYADVVAALRSPGLSAAGGQQGRQEANGVTASMLTTDGDEHTRLRIPAQSLLSPGAVRELAPGLAAVTAACVADLGVESDLERDLCAPWATAVLATLLDVPDGPARAELARLVPASRAALSPVPSPLVAGRAARVNHQLGGWLRGHLSRLKASTSDSGAARFARDERLDDAEKVAVLALCVVGGWSPLVDLASSGLQLALTHAPLRAWLGDAQQGASYLEELMRWHSPIPYVARRATEEVTLPSGRLPVGSFVLALLGSANRDESQFEQPDELLPDRLGGQSLALGHGVHYCMGAALVRAALPALLHHATTAHPVAAAATPLTWSREQFPRRVRSTVVRWQP